MSVGDGEHEVFLGREIGHRRTVSEHTARQVDTEVKRILDESHERARTILEDENDLMERIAEALLERETLDHEEIGLLAMLVALSMSLPAPVVIRSAPNTISSATRPPKSMVSWPSSHSLV